MGIGRDPATVSHSGSSDLSLRIQFRRVSTKGRQHPQQVRPLAEPSRCSAAWRARRLPPATLPAPPQMATMVALPAAASLAVLPVSSVYLPRPVSGPRSGTRRQDRGRRPPAGAARRFRPRPKSRQPRRCTGSAARSWACDRVTAGPSSVCPSASISIICATGGARAPDAAAAPPARRAPAGRVPSGCRQHLERAGLQRVARQDRGGLVERLIGGSLAPPQVVVIHRRQMVVTGESACSISSRSGHPCGAGLRNGEQPRTLHHQERRRPLAAPKPRDAWPTASAPRGPSTGGQDQRVQRGFHRLSATRVVMAAAPSQPLTLTCLPMPSPDQPDLSQFDQWECSRP